MADQLAADEEAVEIMQRCLELDEAGCRAARWRQTPTWDSFAHVEMIVEVEERHGVSLDDGQLAGLVDFSGLVDLLEHLNATRNGLGESTA